MYIRKNVEQKLNENKDTLEMLGTTDMVTLSGRVYFFVENY